MTYCAAFVRAGLFTEVTTLVLGSVRLCLPGSLAAAYVLFLFTLTYRSGTLQRFRNRHWLLARLHNLIVFADRLPSAAWHFEPIRMRYVSWRRRFDPEALAPFRSICRFSAVVALAACFYPLYDARFLHAGSYSRALTLQKLALGQASAPDGSAALLAPVMFLSGCDGATVVRFAAPLFAPVFALTAFIALYRFTGSSPAGLAGAGLVAGFAAFADAGSLWNYTGPTSFPATGEVLSGNTCATWGPNVANATPCPVDNAMHIRSSVGVGLIWDSPFGPLRFDYSFPLSKQSYDRVQQFRFGGGTKF